MIVCIDKITCARVHQRIIPRWRAKAAEVRAAFDAKEVGGGWNHRWSSPRGESKELEAKANWLEEREDRHSPSASDE
jgi:type I restriction enzyme R subunit